MEGGWMEVGGRLEGEVGGVAGNGFGGLEGGGGLGLVTCMRWRIAGAAPMYAARALRPLRGAAAAWLV